MGALVWDALADRKYETGVSKGVLYVADGSKHAKGVAWNGLTTVTESPSGAEPEALYADNIKYLTIMSAEEFGATIEAYTYPDEFAACDGSADIIPGVTIGQQERKKFALCYRTENGNAEEGITHGYKIHILYGCQAAPSEKAYSTINDSPEAITFSWEVSSTPVPVKKSKPTSVIVIDSTKVDKTVLKKIEDALYGTDSAEPSLLLPDEIAALAVSSSPVSGG